MSYFIFFNIILIFLNNLSVRCHSGHTDLVTGWITQFYKSGYSGRHRGKLSFGGGKDFYNYESHVSTVKYLLHLLILNTLYKHIILKYSLNLFGYSNLETGREFELFSGLFYSTCTIGEDLNLKYPFLRPHFAHVTREKFDTISDKDYDKYNFFIYISTCINSFFK